MDRKDFLEQLFLMFPKNYCEANASIWRRAYEEVLPLTADFDSLMHTMISEYSGSTIPKPAWFKSKPEVTRAIYAEQQKIDAENPIRTKSLYVEIGGRNYEFGYDTKTETEEQAISAIYDRFPNQKIVFKNKKEVFSGYGFNSYENMKSFDAI
jgi:hypothetical protein